MSTIRPAFADPVRDSQIVFRRLLTAMSQPGRIVVPEPSCDAREPLFATSHALCLTLMDGDTPVWLQPAMRRPSLLAHLAFHCGCPIVDRPDQAQFAIIADPATMPDLALFSPGLDTYPDRSATVIIQVASLTTGAPLLLSGPGIDGERPLNVDGLPPGFHAMWTTNRSLYPRGVDLILVDPVHLVGLPRGCRVEA